MEQLNTPSEVVLETAIVQLDEPVLFKGILQDPPGTYIWKLHKWSMPELAEKFGDSDLQFRVGYNAMSMNPQWEANCSTVCMTLKEFLKTVESNVNAEKWYYFDYKYMHEWFKDKPEIISSINWSRFGFNKTGAESTIWIGSKGAHTNCHQDSYGCNLVAQIHGRKQWLLFPPNSTNFIEPTRIPYEESTVYSKFNFFCPSKEAQKSLLNMPHKARLITLEKGDVLLVPGGWWHYVESLDTSVSVNVWLPLISDDEARVKEAIVKLIITGIGKNISLTSEEHDCTLPYCMKLLGTALKECEVTKPEESQCKRMKSSTWTAKELAAQYAHYVKLIPELETKQLEKLLREKGERFALSTRKLLQNASTTDPVDNVDFSCIRELTESVVNALCHPDVVNNVFASLLKC